MAASERIDCHPCPIRKGAFNSVTSRLRQTSGSVSRLQHALRQWIEFGSLAMMKMTPSSAPVPLLPLSSPHEAINPRLAGNR